MFEELNDDEVVGESRNESEMKDRRSNEHSHKVFVEVLSAALKRLESPREYFIFCGTTLAKAPTM